MADPVELKATRKARKGLVTKEINAAERYMAEDDIEEVKSRFDNIKKTFKEFEQSHERYHETVTEETDIDESEDYFYKMQKEYVRAVTSIKAWLVSDDQQAPLIKSKVGAKNSENISRSELLGLLNLPSVQLDYFDGDPLQYHSFFAVFDERVDRVTSDCRIKLSRLLQYCTGKAKRAIRFCSLIDGDQGYTEARNILKKRFGNQHLIADCIIKNLKSSEPVRSADEIRELSDDICYSYITLQKMGKIYEIDTQSAVVEIIHRTPQSLQNRWKKYVFDYKRTNDKYPSFKELMEFMLEVSDEVNDPVYGYSVSDSNSHTLSELKTKRPATSFVTVIDQRGTVKVPECVACGESHRLLYCKKFKSMKPAARLQMVMNYNLCRLCLYSNHATDDCRKTYVCSVPDCGQRHTKFVHVDNGFGSDTTQGKLVNRPCRNIVCNSVVTSLDNSAEMSATKCENMQQDESKWTDNQQRLNEISLKTNNLDEQCKLSGPFCKLPVTGLLKQKLSACTEIANVSPKVTNLKFDRDKNYEWSWFESANDIVEEGMP